MEGVVGVGGAPSIVANRLAYSILRDAVKTGKPLYARFSVLNLMSFLSDECRFPHVLPDGSGNQQNTPFYPNRNGARTRGNNAGNGFTAIDEKLANLNIRDVCWELILSGIVFTFFKGSISPRPFIPIRR